MTAASVQRIAAGGIGKRAFFSWPLGHLVEMLGPIADAIRTLPDHQLSEELGELRAICSSSGGIPAQTMLSVYETETARRADPALQFDDALDLALCRLEAQTNDADRVFVRDVGQKLFAIGGREAMAGAYRRMMALARPSRRAAREKVLAKRWEGIAGRSGASSAPMRTVKEDYAVTAAHGVKMLAGSKS